jgi:hypothetical protein
MTEPRGFAESGPLEFKLAPSFPGLGCRGLPIREVLCRPVMADPAHILPYK